MRNIVAVMLVAILLGATSGALAATSGDFVGQTGPAQTGELDIDPDDVVMWADLQADGDAAWRIEYRVRLDDDQEIAAFDELQDDIETNTSAYVDRFRERMEQTAADASVVTGRSMAIQNVTIETERRFIDREFGIVTYRFEWTNFARVDGEDLRAGDALAGFFLTEDTNFVMRWPEGYSVVEVAPEPTAQEDRTVHWAGPREFADDEPRLVVSTAADDLGDGGPPWLLIAAAIVVFLGLGGAAYAYRHRGGGTSATGEAAESSPADDTLLSNEERVIKLLEDHDGRMKQQEVAEALGWTDAKTSKVVRSLREEGDVEGFRLGRENVLRLPEADDEELPDI